MEHVLTVSQFVEVVNFTFDALEEVTVEGEVDDFKLIQGKWVTFLLKDEGSSINCFMPVWQYRTHIENGMLVKAVGQPRLRNKGFFSFVLQTVTPSGEGSLKRALFLLQQKLTAEGLFAPERKRFLPTYPNHIALITSRDAAAYGDFLKVLSARQGGLTISFIHTAVQGEDAPRQIMKAMEVANTLPHTPDVIVLVRGGGSLEDLMAFNDEGVVRAVATSRTPTVVGIGHERDSTLAEMAADVRASTPSNSAELVVKTREEIQAHIQQLHYMLTQNILQAIERTQAEIVQQRTDLTNCVQQALSLTHEKLQHMTRVLISFSPQATLARGYSLTKKADGTLIKNIAQVKKNSDIITVLQDGSFNSTVN